MRRIVSNYLNSHKFIRDILQGKHNRANKLLIF